jgi:signal transduction histidine kinase
MLLVADEPGSDLVPRGIASADPRRPAPSRPLSALPAGHPLARWLGRRPVALGAGRGGEPAAARVWLADQGADAALALPTEGGALAGVALLVACPGALPARAALARIAARAAVRLEAARLKEQLIAARAALERAERLAALGTLAAALAHELRNPLVAIRTFAQLLPERYDDPDFRTRFAPIALGEIDRASALVGELLEYARAPRPAEPIVPAYAPEDVNVILGQILTLAEAEARNRRIRIARRLDPALPKLPLDRDRMKQLFLNLLLNAIQAIEGDDGEVVVETAAARGEDGAWIAIDVRDTGTGIAADDLASLFTPFFSRKPQGVGLGLSICRDIVQAHHGRIHVVSELGRGTTVQVRLPVGVA